MEDLANKLTGGTLTASEWNQLAQEMQSIITARNQILSAGDLTQGSKSLSNAVAEDDWYTDSGSANTYILSTQGSIPGITSYEEGHRVRFVPAASSTSTTITVDVNGLGAVPVVAEVGSSLIGNEIVLNKMVELRYFDSFSSFIIVPSARSSLNTTSQEVLTELDIPNTQDTETIDDLTVTIPPNSRWEVECQVLFFYPVGAGAAEMGNVRLVIGEVGGPRTDDVPYINCNSVSYSGGLGEAPQTEFTFSTQEDPADVASIGGIALSEGAGFGRLSADMPVDTGGMVTFNGVFQTGPTEKIIEVKTDTTGNAFRYLVKVGSFIRLIRKD